MAAEQLLALQAATYHTWDPTLQRVCENAVGSDEQIRVAAFECLVAITQSYYDKLPKYIQDIFVLTHRWVRTHTVLLSGRRCENLASVPCFTGRLRPRCTRVLQSGVRLQESWCAAL